MQLYNKWLVAFSSLMQMCDVLLSDTLIRKVYKSKRFDIYKEIAETSGGWILDLEKSDRKGSELLTNMTIHEIQQKIFVIEECLNPKFEFTVEKIAEFGYIIVNSRTNIKNVMVISPSGSTNDYKVNVKDESLFVGEIQNQHGLWKVEVELKDQSKAYKAMAAVKSDLYLTIPLFLDYAELDRGTKLTPGLTYSAFLSFNPENDVKDTSLRMFENAQRKPIHSKITGDKKMFNFECPDRNFFLEAIGTCEDGTKFQRWIATIYEVEKDDTKPEVKNGEVTTASSKSPHVAESSKSDTKPTEVPPRPKQTKKVKNGEVTTASSKSPHVAESSKSIIKPTEVPPRPKQTKITQWTRARKVSKSLRSACWNCLIQVIINSLLTMCAESLTF